MTDSVKTRFEVENRMTPELNSINRQLNNVSSNVSTAFGAFTGALGGVAAIGVVSRLSGAVNGLVSNVWDFLKVSRELNTVQQDAEKKLEQVERSMGSLGGYTAEQIKLYASLRQEVTKFGDEVSIRAAANLGTFGNIRDDVFLETLAMAQDMAEFFGTDLFNEITGLGRALNDPIKGLTALSRRGISFTNEQTDMISKLVEQNNIYGAQKLILEELANQYGGQSTNAVSNFNDKLIQFNNAWGDFQERMGGAVDEVASDFIPALENLQSKLDPIATTLEELIKHFAALAKEGVEAFASITGETVTFQDAMTGVTATMSMLRTATAYLSTGAEIAKDTVSAGLGAMSDEELDRRQAQSFTRLAGTLGNIAASTADSLMNQLGADEFVDRLHGRLPGSSTGDSPTVEDLLEEGRRRSAANQQGGGSVWNALLGAGQRLGEEIGEDIGQLASHLGLSLVEALPVAMTVDKTPEEKTQFQAQTVALTEMNRNLQLAAASTVESPEARIGKEQVGQLKEVVHIQKMGLDVFNKIQEAVDKLTLGVSR